MVDEWQSHEYYLLFLKSKSKDTIKNEISKWRREVQFEIDEINKDFVMSNFNLVDSSPVYYRDIDSKESEMSKRKRSRGLSKDDDID